MSECPWEEECQVWDLDSVQWVQVQALVPDPWVLAALVRDRCNTPGESPMVNMGCPRDTLGESLMVNMGCPRDTPVSPSNMLTT